MGALLSSGGSDAPEEATCPLTPRTEQLIQATNTMHTEITALAVTIQQLFGDASVWILRVPSTSRTRRPLANLNIDVLMRRTQSLAFQIDELLRRHGDAYPYLFFLDRALDTLSIVIVGKYSPAGHEQARYGTRWIRAEGMTTRHQIINLLETCLKGLAAVTEMSDVEFEQMRDADDIRSWINMARIQLQSLRRMNLQDVFDRALVPIFLDTIEAMFVELTNYKLPNSTAEPPLLSPRGNSGIKRSQSTTSVSNSPSTRRFGLNSGGKASSLTITTASRRTQSDAGLKPIREEHPAH